MINDNKEGQKTIHPKKFKNTGDILNILYQKLSIDWHNKASSYNDALYDITAAVIPDFIPHFNHEKPVINDKDIVHVLFINGNEISTHAELINWAAPKTSPQGVMFYAIVTRAV